VGVTRDEVRGDMELMGNLEALPKSPKLAALHEDADWVPPLYDIWNVSSNLRPDAASYLRGCLVRMTPATGDTALQAALGRIRELEAERDWLRGHVDTLTRALPAPAQPDRRSWWARLWGR